MADSSGTGNTAPTLTTVTILMLIWAAVSYGVRLWVKLQKRDHWGLDDVSISLALVATLAQAISLCSAVHRGYGSPWRNMSIVDRVAVEKSLYASQLLYVISIGFTKISTGFFTSSVLTRDPRNIKIARIFVGLCAAWLIASAFAIALRGDLLQPWATLNDTMTVWARWAGIESSGFAMDILGAIMATYLVWSLQMALSKKLAVFAIFNCRLFLALPIAFRLYYLYPSVDRTNPMPADIITEVIQGTAIIFASITCLKPFLTPFDPVAFKMSGPRSGIFRYTAETQASRSDRYFELSGQNCSGTDKKNKVVDSSRSMGGDGSQAAHEDELPLTDTISSIPTFRPAGVAHSARAQSTHWREPSGGGSGDGSGNSISKTRSWTVSIRDR